MSDYVECLEWINNKGDGWWKIWDASDCKCCGYPDRREYIMCYSNNWTWNSWSQNECRKLLTVDQKRDVVTSSKKGSNCISRIKISHRCFISCTKRGRTTTHRRQQNNPSNGLAAKSMQQLKGPLLLLRKLWWLFFGVVSKCSCWPVL